MFSALKFHSNKRDNNDGLSKCWLAGINLNLFKQKFKSKEDLEIVNISEMCQEINDYVQTEENDSRFSRYCSSMLLYGTVCIYQKQVHFLFGSFFGWKNGAVLHAISFLENVKSLLFDRLVYLRDEIIGRKRSKRIFSKVMGISDWQPIVTETTTFSSVIFDDEIQRILRISKNTFTICNVETLPIDHSMIQDENCSDGELFGPMTENERENFTALAEGRITMEELANRAIGTEKQNRKRQSIEITSVNSSAQTNHERKDFKKSKLTRGPKEKITKLKRRTVLKDITNNYAELYKIRTEENEANTSANFVTSEIDNVDLQLFLENNTPDALNQNQTAFLYLNEENIFEISQPILPEFPENLSIEIINPSITQHIKRPALKDLTKNLENDIEESSKIKRKTKRKTMIDIKSKISHDKFRQQFQLQNKNTLRYQRVHEIVNLDKVRKVNAAKLFAQPCRQLFSSSFNEKFQRAWKIKRSASNDLSIEASIVKRSKPLLETNNENSELLSISQKTYNDLDYGQYLPEIEVPLLPAIISESNEKTITAHSVKSDLSTSPTYRVNFGQKGILEKLTVLWKQKTYPITLKNLHGTEITRRNEAAFCFRTILLLSAKQLIKLSKNDKTNEIFNIEPGKEFSVLNDHGKA